MSVATDAKSPGPPPETFACSPEGRRARWILAGSMLAAGAIAGFRVDPSGVMPGALPVRALLVAVGAATGFRFLLSSRDVRVRATARESDLLLEIGSKAFSVAYGAIEALDYEHAFRRYSQWLPSLVVVGARGERHRIPALVRGGDRLVRILVARSTRRDLGISAAALGLEARLRRARWIVPLGYALAALLVIAAMLA